jgi:hypothetical protein
VLGLASYGLFSPMVYVGPIGIAISRSLEGVLPRFPQSLSRSNGYYAGVPGIEPDRGVLEAPWSP